MAVRNTETKGARRWMNYLETPRVMVDVRVKKEQKAMCKKIVSERIYTPRLQSSTDDVSDDI